MENRRILAVVTFSFLSILLLGCGKSDPIPESLIGTWRTTDQSYADRFFEISTMTITFGTGGTNSVTHPITGFKIENSKGKGQLLTLTYKTPEGKKINFYFYYLKEGNIIRFKNQEQMIWRKEKIQKEAPQPSGS